MSLTPILAYGAWTAAVTVSDIRSRRIPNGFVLIGILLAVAQWFGAVEVMPITISESVMGGVLAFAAFLPLYVFRAMGAADVKVFAVLGFWLGLPALLPIWMIASAAAGIHALYAIARVHLPMVPMFGRVILVPAAPEKGVRGAPYGAFLVLAGLILVLRAHVPSIASMAGG